MNPKCGRQLLNSLVHSKDGDEKFRKLPLDRVFFKGSELELYDVIHKCFLRTGQLPHKTTLQDDYGLGLGKKVPEPPEYYFDLVKERHVHMALKQAFLEGADHLNKGSPYDALQSISEAAQGLVLSEHKNRILDYAQEGHGMISDEYLRQKRGLDVGLPMGWPTLDEMAGGMRGGDLFCFVGRPASGKTYCGLYTALSAWRADKIPLFISMEMKPLLIAQRLAAMDAKCSITQLKKAELSTKKEEVVMAQLESNKSKTPFWIVDGSLALNVSELTMQVQQLKPDAVYIDGAYLMQSDNPRLSRWEKNTDVAEKIKSRIAEDMNIPAVISYQMNRQAQRKDGGGLDTIAYTDAIGQLSSVVLGMMEDESIETLKRRKISILKGRSGESGEFIINWNFDNFPFMDFSEVAPTEVSSLQFL